MSVTPTPTKKNINNVNNINNINNIPDVVFIIPYRNREAHLNCFLNHMQYILEDVSYSYEIVICHQDDTRPFNRGAMKNLGFIYIKHTYPTHYKNITLVFHDVDTMPGKKQMFDYRTTKNIVKHFYGFTFALGGIFSITGGDFELVGGFPNYWSWGFEDNVIYNRCIEKRIQVDRSKFYEYNHLDILQFFNGIDRNTNAKIYLQFKQFKKNNIKSIEKNDGITSIQNIHYIPEYTKSKDISYTFVHHKVWTLDESNPNKVFESSTENVEKSLYELKKYTNLKPKPKLFLM
jgi:hypothetical protein